MVKIPTVYFSVLAFYCYLWLTVSVLQQLIAFTVKLPLSVAKGNYFAASGKQNMKVQHKLKSEDSGIIFCQAQSKLKLELAAASS